MKYTINGREFYSIQEFAQLIHREIPSVRHLLFDGNVVRKMNYIRDRSRIFIPVEELTGFPHVNSGKQTMGLNIYHYDEEGNRVLCAECTYKKTFCEKERIAEHCLQEEEGNTDGLR